MQVRDALAVERQQFVRAVADPERDAVAAQIERQREAAAVAGGGRQGRQPGGVRAERHVPAMVRPRGVGDAQLAEHLAGEMERREGRSVAGRRRVSGHVMAMRNLCILQRGIARAAGDGRSTSFASIHAARRPGRARALRVAALGKSGQHHRAAEIAGRRWTRTTRAAEGPKIHALREEVSGRHRGAQGRRWKPPNWSGGWRPSGSTCRCPQASARIGSVHPVSQVMDELAEIFADLGFAVAEGPGDRGRVA